MADAISAGGKQAGIAEAVQRQGLRDSAGDPPDRRENRSYRHDAPRLDPGPTREGKFTRSDRSVLSRSSTDFRMTRMFLGGGPYRDAAQPAAALVDYYGRTSTNSPRDPRGSSCWLVCKRNSETIRRPSTLIRKRWLRGLNVWTWQLPKPISKSGRSSSRMPSIHTIASLN